MSISAKMAPTARGMVDIQFKAYDENGALKTYTITKVTIDTNREDAFKGGEGSYVPVIFKSTEYSILTIA